MIKPIGEFTIIEEYGGEKHSTGIEIFDKSEIEVLKKAAGSKSVIYKSTAEQFLMRIHWMSQFVDWNEVEKELKSWRK